MKKEDLRVDVDDRSEEVLLLDEVEDVQEAVGHTKRPSVSESGASGVLVQVRHGTSWRGGPTMMLWFVLLVLIVFGAIGIAKSRRKSIKYSGTLVVTLVLSSMLVPVLRMLDGWTTALVIFMVLALIGMTIVLLLKVPNPVAKHVAITVILLLVVIGGPAWVYEVLRAPTDEQYIQLAQVIRTHDSSRIRELAADQETENFLLGLPTDARVDATDFQGGGPVGNGFIVGYFPARVGGYDVNTYMLTKSGFQLIPHWKLIQISIDALPPITSMKIDPKWLQN